VDPRWSRDRKWVASTMVDHDSRSPLAVLARRCCPRRRSPRRRCPARRRGGDVRGRRARGVGVRKHRMVGIGVLPVRPAVSVRATCGTRSVGARDIAAREHQRSSRRCSGRLISPGQCSGASAFATSILCWSKFRRSGSGRRRSGHRRFPSAVLASVPASPALENYTNRCPHAGSRNSNR